MPNASKALHAELLRRTSSHEYDIVTGLISRLDGGTLTNKQLWAGLGAIKAVRQLLSKLEREGKEDLERIRRELRNGQDGEASNPR